jgi:hypothetical protein
MARPLAIVSSLSRKSISTLSDAARSRKSKAITSAAGTAARRREISAAE